MLAQSVHWNKRQRFLVRWLWLYSALSLRCEEIRTAANGREAIEVGAHFRPDVLVVDWMLQDQINGLQVAKVLRSVDPRMRAILMTGFASDDLKRESAKLRVHDFLEKPFDLNDLEQSVASAARPDSSAGDSAFFGVLEIDRHGRITFANATARDLLGSAGCTAGNVLLDDLLGERTAEMLALSEKQWVEASPSGNPAGLCWWRSRRWADGGGHLMVVLQAGDGYHRHHPIVAMLLDIDKTLPGSQPFDGHLLILERSAPRRRTLVRDLEQLGCVCHATDDPILALQLAERDPDLGYALLDYDMPRPDLERLVRRLRGIHPALTIVGCAATDRTVDFGLMGVSLFLAQPCAPDDLINKMTGRIGQCVECRLPIPLRRPPAGQTGARWICRGCGARYCAVLDDRFPPDIIANVTAADPD